MSAADTPINEIDDPLGRFRAWLKTAKLQEKPHQINGMKFCIEREINPDPRWDVRGGIIADEMGLGKTILMLGTIVSNFRGVDGRTSTLIVVPPALLAQWNDIIIKFLGHEPLVYHGVGTKLITREQLVSAPIVLTTYGMTISRKSKSRTDTDTDTCLLTSIKWNRLIMDEAHHIRNMSTGTFAAAFKIQANIRWFATGTPIQNDTKDVVALFCALRLHNVINDGSCLLEDLVEHFVLRRTKESVGIKLPALNEELIVVPWESKEEEHLSRQIHSCVSFSDVTVKTVDIAIKCITGTILPVLIRARQSCIFPQLISEAVERLKDQQKIPRSVQFATQVKTCSKIMAVSRHIKQRIGNRRRKIVFCHYRGEIDLLFALLQKWGISVAILDGRSTKRSKKSTLAYSINKGQFARVCKSWNKRSEIYDLIAPFIGPQVILVQINTACEGLNLQHFQEIYFTSPHWNPSVEDQAIARAHRIGQEEKVNVFRFIMSNFGKDGKDGITIDKHCLNIQKAKRELMALVNNNL